MYEAARIDFLVAALNAALSERTSEKVMPPSSTTSTVSGSPTPAAPARTHPNSSTVQQSSQQY
jgi:hypothetical protein